MRLKTPLSILALSAACLAAPAFSQDKDAADPLATINGEAVSAAEFGKDWTAFVGEQKKVMKADAMTPEWEAAKKRMLLDKIVDERLVLQEAKKRAIAVDKKDMDAAVARVKAKFKYDKKGQVQSAEAREEAFKKELAGQGITQAKFEEVLRNQLLAAALTKQVIKERVKAPTDEQIHSLFDAVKDGLDHPKDAAAADNPRQAAIDALTKYFRDHMAERVRLAHILVLAGPDASAEKRAAASKKADEIKAKLDGGARFSVMAREMSDDKATAKSGGDAGYFIRGEIKELDDAAFSLPVGGVSGVIKTKLGYEIVKVEEKKAAIDDLRYEDARSYLAEYILRAAEEQAYADFLADLRKAATIDLRASFAKPTHGG